MGGGSAVIDMPSGYDWYDGAEADARRAARTRRPRRSKRRRHWGLRDVRDEN